MKFIIIKKKKYSMNTIKTSDEAMTKVFQKRKKIGMYNSLPVETKKKLNICYLSVCYIISKFKIN